MAQAQRVLPLIKRQHMLLVTLLMCNAGAMEALPVVLNTLVPPAAAVLISVTMVLLFGEIIPQAVCQRFGLAIGAALFFPVAALMVVTSPVSYPLGRLLDAILGADHDVYFRRAQLKALVDLHGEDEGGGGELSKDETLIISGALDLTHKTAESAMTPIAKARARAGWVLAGWAGGCQERTEPEPPWRGAAGRRT